MKALGRFFKGLAAMAAVVSMFAAGAFAQGANTAYVPFVVNADATVTAVQDADTVKISVTAGVESVLVLPRGVTSVWNTGGARGRLNAPIITNSRGNITLRLPPQSYRNAEIALHSVNGKRVLRAKAAASEAGNAISRRNVAPGVYMLSVKGANSSAVTTRLTHEGGNLNISVAFGAENVSPERRLEKQAADGDWEITVSAVDYITKTYTLRAVVGMNETQFITLDPAPQQTITTFIDSRDGKTYKKVTIGTQTWMGENLNYDVPNNTSDVCYGNSADSCAKYGRLYNWATAMNGASSSSLSPSGVQGACPVGWHVPSHDEWTTLENYVGSNAGTKLKSTSGWIRNGNGTDDFGWSALSGGFGYSDGDFSGAGSNGNWWSATEDYARFAWYRYMSYDIEYVSWRNDFKANLFSVRCAQDR